MKQLVFRYDLLTQDINLKGYPNGVPDCFKAYEAIDGRNVFYDKEVDGLVCYKLIDGCDYPCKIHVLKYWCEEVEL